MQPTEGFGFIDPCFHVFDGSDSSCFTFIIGHKSVETITMTNDESEAFEFSFDEASCQLTSFTAQLVIKPKQGTIQPKSRLYGYSAFLNYVCRLVVKLILTI